MSMRFCILILSLFVSACASTPEARWREPKKYTSYDCQSLFRSIQNKVTDAQLDGVSNLFHDGCFEEVLVLSEFLRNHHRDKFYSVSTEVAEVFAPEGAFNDYVLESYERSMLALYSSLSFLKLGRDEAAQVELRRMQEEENAVLYNYGEDPVVALVMAALWDRFDPVMARPHWKRLGEFKGQDKDVKAFVLKRLEQIDKGPATPVNWGIFAVGRLPDLDWKAQFFTSKPYKIIPKTAFPYACSSPAELRVPTHSWVKKIEDRYDSDYHSLLYVKSLVRFPIGVGYGILGVSSAVAVGAAGCAAATQVEGQHGGELCGAAIQAGAEIGGQTMNFVEYVFRPDMRRWKALPRAVVVRRTTTEPLQCAFDSHSAEAWLQDLSTYSQQHLQ